MSRSAPRSTCLSLVSVLLAPFLGQPLLAQTGAIRGSAMGEDGAMLRGVLVAAVRRYPIQGKTRRISTMVTGANGSFQFDALDPGAYLICGQIPGSTYIDPCHWSGAPPVWNLEAGQTASVNVQLKRGV